ncbi:hypothetical protein [Sphingopyxis sp.]|jgi:hypothetical protein|uniref:hypothetical protein n=1 Tax=Sphingopyxis sp. TaxID=1908224 RepID=UPI0025DE27AD|nr:hypothetical protein [Sphingopyxis sp.]MBK6411620.1 hypothetical protein [Sphingopyxis sp.]
MEKLVKLNAEHFARTAKVTDDEFEVVTSITSANGFNEKGSFSARVRSGNFVRALVAKPTGVMRWQIYQSVTYSGEWRRFTSANMNIGDRLVSRELEVISRDIITCDYGLCVYREIVAITLEGSEAQALTASTNTAPGAVLSFRLKAQSGIDWDDDIPLAELAGIARVVADYRQKAGIK